MSTLTTPAPVGASGRIINVVKLNLANPWTTIIMPWMILGILFAGSWVIWWLIVTAVGPNAGPDVLEGTQWSGASLWIFVYMMVVAIQAINLTFPLALGYGVTRRDFWLGTSVTFVLLTIMFTLGLTILSVVEEATGGWGLGGRMFTAAYFGEDWLQRMFIYITLMLFFYFFGAAIASVYVRWKATGVSAFFIAVGAILIAAGAIVTFAESWPQVWSFFGELGLTGIYALSYPVTIVSAVVGYFILRWATPKS